MNLKKAGQYLLLAWWLYLWAEIALDKLSDYRKTHQEDISAVLSNKDLWMVKNRYYSYTKEIGKTHPYGNITYKHQDITTTQILNALSGFDTKILYPDTTDTAKEGVWEQDSVMYKTIWMMNTKYKNPKIELVEKFSTPVAMAMYHDSMNIISLQKDTGNGFIQKYCMDKKSNTIWLQKVAGNKFNQWYYLESWIAELAHAYQAQRDGLKAFREKFDNDYLLAPAKKDVHDIPWTVEYEAHHAIEYMLKKEFIDTYISLCDTNNVEHLSKIIALNTWLFESYDNIKEAKKYYEKILAIGWEKKAEPMLKNIPWICWWYQCEDKRKKSKDDRYRQLARFCFLWAVKYDNDFFEYASLSRLYASKWDIENAVKYRQLYWQGSSKEDALISVAWDLEIAGKYNEALQILEYEAKKWNLNAMVELADFYDPKYKDRDNDKKNPYKNKEKKEYREKKIDKVIERMFGKKKSSKK